MCVVFRMHNIPCLRWLQCIAIKLLIVKYKTVEDSIENITIYNFKIVQPKHKEHVEQNRIYKITTIEWWSNQIITLTQFY